MICIIEDHGSLKTRQCLTEELIELNLPYYSWKGIKLNVTIIFGKINTNQKSCGCVIFVKETNMGKRDSLILSHDCFNEPRISLNETNITFRNTLRCCIKDTYGFDRFEFMFFTDGDSCICKNSFQYLIESIKFNNAIAACGLVRVNNPCFEFWNMLQNFQYFYGQYIRRKAESVVRKVTCLPGCITMMKIDVVARHAIDLYAEMTTEEVFVKRIVQTLGTDRRLTCSFLFQDRKQFTVVDYRAVCLTNTPTSFLKYLDQRRRWCSNAYFNSIFTLLNTNVPIITRVFALLDYLRMSLIYFRCFNTVLFLVKLVRTSQQWEFLLIQLSPCICIVCIPIIYFVCLVVSKGTTFLCGVYLCIGFCLVKCLGTLLSVCCVSNMLWFCGDQKWTQQKKQQDECV